MEYISIEPAGNATVRLTGNAVTELDTSISREASYEEVIGIKLAIKGDNDNYMLGEVQNDSGPYLRTLCCHR